MSEIASLNPQALWQWFDKICAIPHPSYHEEQIANFIIDWAKSQSLFVERDDAGNILIRKPATKGMENRQTLALQAHLDMVPQANASTVHNFLKDPIQPYQDGEWVKAKGTTLGADNGIGLASCLAVLSSTNLAHPEIEVLLTMSEEVGMEGALGLRPNWLTSNIMINTDTEDNGEIYIGCAGGENVEIHLPIEFEKAEGQAVQITLKGLRGGHSGCDIHTNRVNAIKLLTRILSDLYQAEVFQLVNIKGGSVRNAIPREAHATLLVKDVAKITACIEQLQAKFQSEYHLAEPNLTLVAEVTNSAKKAFTAKATQTALQFLTLLPNGVIRNSDTVKNVVETSLSIGVLSLQNEQLVGTILSRSLVEHGKEEVRSRLNALAQLTGATVEYSGNYPGWEPAPNSEITALTKKIYNEVLGYEAQIKVIHAGLECGLIKEIYPNMDLVSIGPTIRNAHSPDEKVNIPAVQIYWELLTKLLANAPQK